MIHFKPTLFKRQLRAAPAAPSAVAASAPARAQGRADHARMLAYAAKRRLCAGGADGDYWKACAPAAIAKAMAIRGEGSFARLP